LQNEKIKKYRLAVLPLRSLYFLFVVKCYDVRGFAVFRIWFQSIESIGKGKSIENYQIKPFEPILQCKLFLFIFTFKNKTHYQY
jgi:hypothetical protein